MSGRVIPLGLPASSCLIGHTGFDKIKAFPQAQGRL